MIAVILSFISILTNMGMFDSHYMYSKNKCFIFSQTTGISKYVTMWVEIQHLPKGMFHKDPHLFLYFYEFIM